MEEIKKELVEIKEILLSLLELEVNQFNLKYGWMNNEQISNQKNHWE